MNKFNMYVCGDDVMHKFEKSSLSSYIAFIEEKGFSIERPRALDDIVLLSGSRGLDYFFVVKSSVSDVTRIIEELDSIYSFLPLEKSKNKKYMLVEKNNREFIVDQETETTFFLTRRLSGKKVNGFKILNAELDFNHAYNLLKTILMKEVSKGD